MAYIQMLTVIIKAIDNMKIKVPYWIKVFWIIVLPGLLIFTNQMSYEILYLTYKIAPYMIGIPMIDANPTLWIFMVFSYFASIIWIAIYTIWIVKILKERQKPQVSWIYISTVLIVLYINLLDPLLSLIL